VFEAIARAQRYALRELQLNDREDPVTSPTSSEAIGGWCIRRHARPAPIARIAVGLAAARSFRSAMIRWMPSWAASLARTVK
jgi:hypothetical protein